MKAEFRGGEWKWRKGALGGLSAYKRNMVYQFIAGVFNRLKIQTHSKASVCTLHTHLQRILDNLKGHNTSKTKEQKNERQQIENERNVYIKLIKFISRMAI